MREILSTALKGAAMGIAEVIPGVSGGTIAFITGIYERLLLAIRSIQPSLIKTFKEEGFKAVLNKIDFYFLVKLFFGMVVGFGLGLFLITHLLENHPILIWSFFFGLILASIPLVAREVKQWNWKLIALLILGTVFVYWITIAAPSQGNESLWFVFISGLLAVSALMLPGLSGSFVLLLLGMYTVIMPAIKSFIESPFGPETTMLIVFGLGLIVGIFSFARVLSWTFERYRNQTLALLTGFLLGSLNKVWPWQQVLSTRVGSSGEEKVMFSKSISPKSLEALDSNFLYGTDAQLIPAMAIMLGGIGIVYLLAKMGSKQK
ncbi:MAG: DUF368 domain-containing protein [Bacteroidia bacterium]